MTNISKTFPVVPVAILTVFAVLAAKIRAAIEAQAPMGYQDETGFHPGIKPRGQEANWQAGW
jgi:hypothetical protein